MIRIFFAVPLPDEVQRILQDLQDQLRDLSGRVRWVKPASTHLTLKFIGEVEEERARHLWEALEDVELPEPHQVPLTQTGVFPNPGRARVLWVGLEQTDPVMHLAERIETRSEQEGVAPDRRKFHPHLTLGRVKRRGISRRQVDTFLHLEVPDAVIPVQSIVCYQSDLQPDGAVYTSLHTINL